MWTLCIYSTGSNDEFTAGGHICGQHAIQVSFTRMPLSILSAWVEEYLLTLYKKIPQLILCYDIIKC